MKCHIAWLYWFIGIIIFCIDRITKNSALDSFVQQVYSSIPGLSFKVVINRGVTWGMLHYAAHQYYIYVMLSVIKVLGIMLVAYWAYYVHKKCEKFVFGHVLVIAGGLSNMLDRLCYGGVIDFIIVSYGHHSWPVFNVADVAIVVGLGIVAWQLEHLPEIK